MGRGRPELSVDADAGPVAKFACDLRALRKAAGSPSYRELAKKANYSATVLSRAASGKELPSLSAVIAYVAACGGDADEWRNRWLELSEQPDPTAGPDSMAEGSSGSPAGRTGRAKVIAKLVPGIRSHGLTIVIALVAAAAVGTAITLALRGPVAATGPRKGPRITVTPGTRPAVPADTPLSDGHDPTPSGCAPDAVTVASAFPRLSRTVTIAGKRYQAGTVAGVVELRYSAHCHAAWARAEPGSAFAGPRLGWADVRISRPADGTFESFNVAGIAPLYGDLLLTRHGCLTASVTLRFRVGATAQATTRCWQPG